MRKPRVRVEFRLSQDMKDRIREYSEKEKLNESQAVRKLIREALRMKDEKSNPDTE